MTTRRWYYLIPRIGSPRALVHAIERHNLDTLPGDKTVYAGREALAQGLDQLLDGVGRRRDGILARERDPVSVARRCRHGGV